MSKRPKYSVISLFSGVGGIDYGLEHAGFATAAAVELDATCCETLRTNRRWNVLEGDITETSSRDILSEAGLSAREADLLVAGPPCQPFSKANYWRSGRAPALRDSRTNTLDALVRVVKDTLPRVVLVENVPAFAHKGSGGLRMLLDSFADINRRRRVSYAPQWKILDCAGFGVPQHRNRFFLVAQRDGARFDFPEAAFGEGTQTPYRTTWDVLWDVRTRSEEDLEVTGRWAKLLPSIPEGKNYLWHTPKGGGLSLFGWRTRYWTFLLKLAKSLPAWTLQANPGPSDGPFHWNNRRLSVAEIARLQTLPDDVKIQGSPHQQRKQVGNAVPSLMAEVLGREIRHQLFRDPVTQPPVLLRPKCPTIPPPERRGAVPEHFRDQVGDHAAHPGKGKGPGARERLARRRA